MILGDGNPFAFTPEQNRADVADILEALQESARPRDFRLPVGSEWDDEA